MALKWNVRGERAGYLLLATRNAQLTLVTELTSQSAQHARSEALREMLGLAEQVRRVECFDISHTMGEATVASCVVFDASGPVRGQYRRFNISGITPGDDYAAMHQALTRRFRKAAEARASVAEGEDPDTAISRPTITAAQNAIHGVGCP